MEMGGGRRQRSRTAGGGAPGGSTGEFGWDAVTGVGSIKPERSVSSSGRAQWPAVEMQRPPWVDGRRSPLSPGLFGIPAAVYAILSTLGLCGASRVGAVRRPAPPS